MVELLAWSQNGSFLVASELYGARDKINLLQVNAEVVHLHLATAQQRYRCEVCSVHKLGAKKDLPCPYCHGNLKDLSESEVLQNRNVKRILADKFVPLEAGEHTAQIPNDVRVELEENFAASVTESKINLLACSPTLEMGIDVGGLNAVILRS